MHPAGRRPAAVHIPTLPAAAGAGPIAVAVADSPAAQRTGSTRYHLPEDSLSGRRLAGHLAAGHIAEPVAA